MLSSSPNEIRLTCFIQLLGATHHTRTEWENLKLRKKKSGKILNLGKKNACIYLFADYTYA